MPMSFIRPSLACSGCEWAWTPAEATLLVSAAIIAMFGFDFRRGAGQFGCRHMENPNIPAALGWALMLAGGVGLDIAAMTTMSPAAGQYSAASS